MMKAPIFIFKFSLLVFGLLFCLRVEGQPANPRHHHGGGGGCGGHHGHHGDCPHAPIDKYAGVLVLAGMSYGAYKYGKIK